MTAGQSRSYADCVYDAYDPARPMSSQTEPPQHRVHYENSTRPRADPTTSRPDYENSTRPRANPTRAQGPDLQRYRGHCFLCGQQGHRVAECRQNRTSVSPQFSVSRTISEPVLGGVKIPCFQLLAVFIVVLLLIKVFM